MAMRQPDAGGQSTGRLIAMSTPFGKRGWFWSAWSEGDDWERSEVRADQCPRISPTFLAQERRALPDLWFRSEYLCAFLEPDDSYFRHEAIANAFAADDVEPLFPLEGLPDLSSIEEVEPW